MNSKINALQFLRTIAVSLVVLVHSFAFGLPIFSLKTDDLNIYNFDLWGVIGVDLFFAISGFIMIVIIPSYETPGGSFNFLVKRLLRILPLYYLITLFEFIIQVIVHHEKMDVTQMFKSILLLPFFDNTEFSLPYLGVGWSLSFELYFYIIISLCLIFNKNTYKLTSLSLIVLGICGIFFNPSNAFLKFLISPMLFEFALGIGCGIIYKKFSSKNVISVRSKTMAMFAFISGLSLISFTIFFKPEYNNMFLGEAKVITNNNSAALLRVIYLGIPSAIFLLGCVLLERFFSLTIPAILILFGDASFSCYLIHSHILLYVARVIHKASLGPFLFLILVVPICLIISVLFYKFVERPLTNLINSALRHKKN